MSNANRNVSSTVESTTSDGKNSSGPSSLMGYCALFSIWKALRIQTTR
jgi:hypothetical protein